MAMFQLDIAFLLELALFSSGLIVLYFGREKGAGLLKAAGAVLVVGSVLTALCSSYFGVRYHIQGEFDHAHPAHHQMTERAHHMPSGGPMGPGMMHSPAGSSGMMEPPASSEPASGDAEESHEQHHPEEGSSSEPADR